MGEKKYLDLDDISAYKRSFEFSNYIWNIVVEWSNFEKFTIGKQLIQAADSISSNIAEGFHRYHKKDKVHFYYFSKGSVGECKDWVEKAWARKLLSKEDYNYIKRELSDLPREINSLIKFTYQKLKD